MSFMIFRGRVDGNQVGLIVSYGPRNRFTKNGTIFERIRCVRAWSSIGSNGRIARDFSMMKSDLVGRLTRSLPLTRSDELPVYVARVPAGSILRNPAASIVIRSRALPKR